MRRSFSAKRVVTTVTAALGFFLAGCDVSEWLKFDNTMAARIPEASPDTGDDSSSPSICPTGFIRIPSTIETQLGYSVCVAKYEMKLSLNDGTAVLDGRGTTNVDPALHIAVSRAAGTPWTRLTYAEILSEYSGLGAKYSLMSNREWDALASDIVGVSSNWSSGRLRSGNSDSAIDINALADGWTYANSAALLAAGVDSNGYEGTGNTASQAYGAGGEQNRTYTFSNGEVIWDMAGNARDIVDADGLGGTISYSGAPGMFVDLNSATMASFIGVAVSSNGVSFGSAFRPSNLTWDHTNQNIGRFYIEAGALAGRVISRGANYSAGNSPGLFAGDVDEDATTARSSTGGFRCVYKP